MKRKTTIALTITALLGLTGVLYAANHSFFSPVQDPTYGAGPVGVSAAPADLIATEYCTNTTLKNVDKITCQGGFAVLAQIPTTGGGGCAELYKTFASTVDDGSIPVPFAPSDFYNP